MVCAMRKGPKAGFYYAVSAIPLMIAGILGAELFPVPIEAKQAIFIGLLVLAAIFVVIGAVKEMRDEEKRDRDSGKGIALYGMLISALMFIGFAAWHFWPRDNLESTSNPLDGTVGVSCVRAARPVSGRPDKILYIMQLINPFGEDGKANELNGGFVTHQPGDGQFNWNGMPISEYNLCRIVNYGDKPIFEVSVDLMVSWYSVERSENSMKTESIISSQIFSSPKFDIGAGASNEEFFYITNHSEFMMYVALPDHVRMRTANATQTINIKLAKTTPSLPFDGWFRPAGTPFIAPAPVQSQGVEPDAAASATKEQEDRKGFLSQLVHNYMLSHDGISPDMASGLELPPAQWLNSQLKKYGKSWRVRNIHGPNYEIYDSATSSTKR
jgi:hypothetical protein